MQPQGPTNPIYQTTSYVFESAEHAAALYSLKEIGYFIHA